MIYIEVREEIGEWGRILGDGKRQAGFWDQAPERIWQYFEISSISQVILLIMVRLFLFPS